MTGEHKPTIVQKSSTGQWRSQRLLAELGLGYVTRAAAEKAHRLHIVYETKETT